MIVKFWKNFSKRINSTKQPTAAATAELDCRLKEATSLHDPVLQVATKNEFGVATNEFGYEYAYIPNVEKYYFVKDVVSVANGLVEYQLSEDVLATYKNEIGLTDAHVIYSSSDYDPSLIDLRLTMSNLRIINHSGGTEEYRVIPSGGGSYLVFVAANAEFYYSDGVTQIQNTSYGCCVIYALTPEEMETFRIDLMNHLNVLQTFLHGEPLKAILKCLWIPFPVSDYAGRAPKLSKMVIGDIEFNNIEPHILLNNLDHMVFTKSLPCHLRSPLAIPRNDFRLCEPYTTGDLYLPGVGVVKLNMGDWIDSDYIKVRMIYELSTGNALYALIDDYDRILDTYGASIATEYPVAQSIHDANAVKTGLSLIESVPSAVGGGLNGYVSGGAAGAALGAISGAVSLGVGAAELALMCNRRQSTIVGNLSGKLYGVIPYIIHTEYSMDTEIVDSQAFLDERGRPHKGMARISDLSGFVQCEGASIVCAASGLEKEEINNHLNNGFFYE